MAKIDCTREFYLWGGDTPSFGLERYVALYREG